MFEQLDSAYLEQALKNMPRMEQEQLANALREQLLRDETLYLESSLMAFFEHAWRWIDPNPYVGGWHLEAMAEHLEAVTNGQIKRLIINVPPRTSKSSLASVAWPAWTWARRKDVFTSPLSGPMTQFLFSSYAQQLSWRDSGRTREIIQSPWYQERWGNRFSLSLDENTKSKFVNSVKGHRHATSVGAGTTGFGGNCLVIDDAHNAMEAESELKRQTVLDWYDRAFTNRLSDFEHGAIVIIMQRLHCDDLVGHILEKDAGEWTLLKLPMEYEPTERLAPTRIGWSDPRQERGDLLWPKKIPKKAVDLLRKDLGPFGYAGQLQQNPVPAGGGIIKRDWWKDWDSKTAIENGYKPGVYPQMEYKIAVLDSAYTEKKENDPSAITIWGVFRNKYDQPRIFLMYAWQDRLEMPALVKETGKICERFKIDKLLIEGKASGLSVSQELRALYSVGRTWGIEVINPDKHGDKVARMHSVTPLFSEGLVYAPMEMSWADMVIEEVTRFPKAKHDDLSDTTSMGLRYLRNIGLAVRREEEEEDYNESVRYKKPTQPLYRC